MQLTTIKQKNSTKIPSLKLKLYGKKNWRLLVTTVQTCKETKLIDDIYIHLRQENINCL